MPCINIEIEGKQIEAEIDVGSNVTVCIAKEILDKIKEKKFIDVNISHGIRGKKYRSYHYEFSEIKLGKATLFRPRGKEMNLDFEKDARINLLENEALISSPIIIGWTFFNPFNLYLDCQKSSIAICDSVETLKKNGCLVDCVETPLVFIGGLIGFDAVTDEGALRCLLDTGSSHNLLNSKDEKSIDDAFVNPKNKIKISFKIGSQDFGEMRFIRAPIKLPAKCDAILGMEFIYFHQIFIDFAKKKIYFSVPKEKGEDNP